MSARERIKAYIDAYEDAPNWGGPTMYPAPPSVADLRTLLAADAGPGWRVVPIKLTDAMLKAGEDAGWDALNSMPAIGAYRAAWSAMLSAAPAPDAKEEGA